MPKLDNYIERKKSVLTGQESLELLYSLKNFPVFMGCVDEVSDEDIVADMDWYICRDTGMIQLKKLIPLEVLYLNQHNEGCGSVWREHYSAFSKFLQVYAPKNILEIGGAHGLIAKDYLKVIPETNWTIIEPNPTIVDDPRIKVIKKWFDNKFIFDGRIEAIVHSHVLEHTFNPAEFITNVAKFLESGQKHIFTFPNMFEQLSRKYTNCLNFEHTVFLTEHFTDYLLIKNGFKILRKEYFRDHSIFYATEKIDVVTLQPPTDQYNLNKKLFLDFTNYHEKLVVELNQKIAAAKQPVYLFGAHIFSQYLIAFGLDVTKIKGILDHGINKCGKRLYGTKFKIEHPRVLAGKGAINVILKAGAYNEEIKKDISENINNKVNFW